MLALEGKAPSAEARARIRTSDTPEQRERVLSRIMRNSGRNRVAFAGLGETDDRLGCLETEGDTDLIRSVGFSPIPAILNLVLA
jgi:hypothetical protein